MVDNLSIAFDIFPIRMLTALLVDEILLQMFMKHSTNFIRLLFNEEMIHILKLNLGKWQR